MPKKRLETRSTAKQKFISFKTYCYMQIGVVQLSELIWLLWFRGSICMQKALDFFSPVFPLRYAFIYLFFVFFFSHPFGPIVEHVLVFSTCFRSRISHMTNPIFILTVIAWERKNTEIMNFQLAFGMCIKSLHHLHRKRWCAAAKRLQMSW